MSGVCICNQTNANGLFLAMLNASSDSRVTNWVDQPSYRGTWDILWTSLVTVFICTYTLLCLNVPVPRDTWPILLRRRLLWMFLAVIAPEIVLTYGCGQWSRARQSVETFQKDGYDQWSMRLAFFADMGGFVLQPPDFETFPVNAKQLHWLILNHHVDYPEARTDEIWDKSKQDRLSKLIASVQIGYFVLQCIGRAAQKLAITTLELNALAIVVCSLLTSYIWLHKPSDIRKPLSLHCRTSMKEIVGSKPWNQTPLDFIDENGPGWALNIQPYMKMPVIPAHRPIQRISNDRFPMNPYGYQEYFLCFGTLLFTGIHVAGWEFLFSSAAEKILWRVSSLILFGVTAAFWILETAASWVRLERWRWLLLKMFDPKKLPDFEKQRTERLQNQTRKATTLPLAWEFWTILPIALLYGIARAFLLTEAFAELRRPKATAYLNVQWSAYIPHI